MLNVDARVLLPITQTSGTRPLCCEFLGQQLAQSDPKCTRKRPGSLDQKENVTQIPRASRSFAKYRAHSARRISRLNFPIPNPILNRIASTSSSTVNCDAMMFMLLKRDGIRLLKRLTCQTGHEGRFIWDLTFPFGICHGICHGAEALGTETAQKCHWLVDQQPPLCAAEKKHLRISHLVLRLEGERPMASGGNRTAQPASTAIPTMFWIVTDVRAPAPKCDSEHEGIGRGRPRSIC